MSAPHRRSGRSLLSQIGPFCAAHWDGRASLEAAQIEDLRVPLKPWTLRSEL